MESIWQSIKNYYTSIGRAFHVDPVIFVGIHVIATPLFILCAGWLVNNYRRKKDIVVPAIVTVFIFNAANIYLVIFGKNISWWVYTILAVTTVMSGYFSYKKIRKKIGK